MSFYPLSNSSFRSSDDPSGTGLRAYKNSTRMADSENLTAFSDSLMTATISKAIIPIINPCTTCGADDEGGAIAYR